MYIENNYGYGSNTALIVPNFFGTIMSFLWIFFIIFGIIVIINIVFTWRVYKKLNIKPWKCLIPFYSSWVLFEKVDLKPWLFLIPFIGPIILFYSFYKMSLKLGSGQLVAILNVIIPIIGQGILAFGSTEYREQVEVPNFLKGIDKILSNKAGNTNIEEYNYNNNLITGENNINGVNTNLINKIESSNVQNNTNIRFCANCGAKIDENLSHCLNCGKEIKWRN